MKLYDLRTGTNTRRVRIFLAEKGVKLPTVEVDMMKGENKTPDYLSKNPMGTMPLLELDDGTLLAESVAICRYMEELQPEPPLFGTTPIERALIEMWNRRMELELLIPIIDNFVHSSAFYKRMPLTGSGYRAPRPHARTGADALARQRIGEAGVHHG
jgi:glutathione S-transferase